MKTTNQKYQLKNYRIRYSVMVNGEEYPNSVTMQGLDKADAENNFRSRFTKNQEAELVIIEVVAI
jgi:hypothetical protein